MAKNNSNRRVELRWWMAAIAVGIWLVASCGYDSSLGNVECDSDDDCPEGAVCEMGYCVAGEGDPECEDEEELCDESCVDVTSDSDHCGGCNISCEDGEHCDDGDCVDDEVECEEGEQLCQGRCVDLMSDEEHCGDCNVECGAEEYCDDGVCRGDDENDCEDDEEWCSGQCVDLTSNDDHCGECGLGCEEDQICVDSICQDVPECEEGELACGMECVDPRVDTEHCGGCDEACGDGEYCQAGQCVDECGEGEEGESFEVCGEEELCIDTNRSIEHCGECDRACEEVSGATGQCVDGECVYQCDDADLGYGYCPEEGIEAGQDTGQGACFDLEGDLDHCGACFQECPDPSAQDADAYAECEDGQCVFQCSGEDFEFCGFQEDVDDGELDLEGASCVNIQEDLDHCGACGESCPDDPLGTVQCVDGSCEVECDGDENIEECEEGVCVDTHSSDEHCGGCDQGCAANEICQGGHCTELPECQVDPDEPFGGGSGEPGDPFVICEADHLRNIEAEGQWNAHFVQVDDIDFSGEAPMEPIGQGYLQSTGIGTGDWQDTFSGSYDGHGFEITNIEINGGSEARTGLFGFVVTGAAVQNVRLVNPTVVGLVDTGAVVGRNAGVVENVSVENATVEGTESVGGVVGRNHQTLRIVEVDDLNVEGNQYVGGVVGQNHGGLSEASVWGEATWISGDVDVGGLVGRNDQSVENSQVLEATVEASGVRVGGAVGYNVSAGTVSAVAAKATVMGTEDVGGLVGRTNGAVTQGEFHGDVVGDDRVGGLVGRVAAASNIYGSYQGTVANSEVKQGTSVTGDWHVGGLVGTSQGHLSDSYSAAQVEGHERRVGGLVGEKEGGSVTRCSASGDVTGLGEVNSVGGLVGRVNSFQVTISESHASGAVSGNGFVGGLVGSLWGHVADSSAEGDVSASGAYVGGLVGGVQADTTWNQQSTINGSYAAGDVDAPQGAQVGGLVGRSEGNIWNSYALGEVTGESQVGGLVGYMWREGYTTGPMLSNVTNSYAYGQVVGTEDVGGLVGLRRDVGGYFMPNVTASYWKITDNVADSDGGDPLTEAEFTAQQNFSGWGFGSVWQMGSDRPVLMWE